VDDISPNDFRLQKRAYGMNKISTKTMEDILKKSYGKEVDKNSKTIIEDIQLLEIKESDLKNCLREMKTAELERINNEFLTKGYERRFNVTLEIVISAIVGESNAGTELIKLSRLQKVSKLLLKFLQEFHDKIKYVQIFKR